MNGHAGFDAAVPSELNFACRRGGILQCRNYMLFLTFILNMNTLSPKVS